MKKSRIFGWTTFTLVLTILAYYQLKPSRRTKFVPWYGWDDPSSTLGHLAGYFILSLIYTLSVGCEAHSLKRRIYLNIPIILVSILFESAQLFLPTRNFNLFDILANIFGVMLACLLAPKLYGRIFPSSPDN